MLLPIFDAYLLDHRLPDLVWHPCRRTLRLINLDPFAGKYMDLLGSSLPKSDVGVATISGLKCCLAGRFACEDSDFVAIRVP